MLLASAFGSTDNTYLDLDFSGYHKNLIQKLFKIARKWTWSKKSGTSSPKFGVKIQAVGRHAVPTGPVQVLELINNCLRRCPIHTGLLISSESNSITA